MVKRLAVIVLLATLTLAVLLPGLNKPFIGQHDWNGVFFGTIVRNYLRYGLLATRFGQVAGFNYTTDNSFRYHTNHPSGFHLLLTLSAWIFGLSEGSLRIVPIIFSVVSIVYMYLLGAYLFDKSVGFLSALLALATPMLRYYGKLPVYEPVVLAFILMGLYHVLLWIEKRRKHDRLFAALAIAFAGVIDWTGFYFWPCLVVWAFIVKKNIPKVWCFWSVWLGTAISLFGHIWILTGNPLGGGIISALQFRLGFSESAGVAPFHWSSFLLQEARWTIVYFTRVLVGLSTLLALIVLWKMWKGGLNWRLSFLIMLAFLGIIHNLIFHQAAWIHDYLLYYLLPFLAISAALVVWEISKVLSQASFGKLIMLHWLFGGLLVLGVWFERAAFVKALDKSNMNILGYKLGIWLSQSSEPSTRFLIASQEFGSFFGTFTSYYADRPLLFIRPSLDTWKETSESFHPSYLIEVKTHNEISEDFRQKYLKRPLETLGPFVKYKVLP